MPTRTSEWISSSSNNQNRSGLGSKAKAAWHVAHGMGDSLRGRLMNAIEPSQVHRETANKGRLETERGIDAFHSMKVGNQSSAQAAFTAGGAPAYGGGQSTYNSGNHTFSRAPNSSAPNAILPSYDPQQYQSHYRENTAIHSSGGSGPPPADGSGPAYRQQSYNPTGGSQLTTQQLQQQYKRGTGPFRDYGGTSLPPGPNMDPPVYTQDNRFKTGVGAGEVG